MDTDTDDFTTLTTSFTSWLPTVGISLHPSLVIADLRAHSAGRGLITTTDLTEDTELFMLPRSAALTTTTSSPSLRSVTSHLSPWLQLILALLHESSKKPPQTSKWGPYLDLLPQAADFDTLMYWSEEELGALRGSMVVGKVGKEEATRVFREEAWPVVRDNLGLFEGCSGGEERVVAECHRWGSVVMAYSFDLDVGMDVDGAGEKDDDEDSNSEEEETPTLKAMLPVADLLNADADRNNARLFQTSATTLSMRTTRFVPAGSELFNDYGPLPTSDLLRRYGYASPAYAVYDVVEVPSPLLVDVAAQRAGLSAQQTAQRVDWLLDEGVLDDAFDILASDCGIPDEVVVAVKTLLAPEERQAWKKPAQRGSMGMSKDVAEVMKDVLIKRLASYTGGSVSEEEDLLSRHDGELSKRQRMAIQVRCGEKKILEKVLDTLDRCLRKRDTTATSGDEEEGRGSSKKARAR